MSVGQLNNSSLVNSEHWRSMYGRYQLWNIFGITNSESATAADHTTTLIKRLN